MVPAMFKRRLWSAFGNFVHLVVASRRIVHLLFIHLCTLAPSFLPVSLSRHVVSPRRHNIYISPVRILRDCVRLLQ